MVKIRLAACRVNARMTIDQVSEETGLGLKKIVDYERGRIPIPREDLEMFARLYDIPVEYIMEVQPHVDFRG